MKNKQKEKILELNAKILFTFMFLWAVVVSCFFYMMWYGTGIEYTDRLIYPLWAGSVANIFIYGNGVAYVMGMIKKNKKK